MSWAVGYDDHWRRHIGYGVPAYCDHPGCATEIDRGLSHVCGGEPYGGDEGCGLHFCGTHLSGLDRYQRCERCAAGGTPFEAKPEHPTWAHHVLSDESWAAWRAESPKLVKGLQDQLLASALAAGQQAIPDGWQLAPVQPTPHIIAAAAIAAWPTASAADIALARQAAPMVLMQLDTAPGITVEMLAATLATMAPAYRAMLAAAGVPPPHSGIAATRATLNARNDEICITDEPPSIAGALERCAAGQDGECGHRNCPQRRDGEPGKSGRHCPLDCDGEKGGAS